MKKKEKKKECSENQNFRTAYGWCLHQNFNNIDFRITKYPSHRQHAFLCYISRRMFIHRISI